MPMDNFSYAQTFREIIKDFIRKDLEMIRPSSSLAIVQTVNPLAKTCTVKFPGETNSVTVDMYVTQPSILGDVVRIEGPAGRRYVTEVVNGRAFIAAYGLTVSNIVTTGASANMCIDSITGLVSRSTSSRRYKKNIRAIDYIDDAVMLLNPVLYESKTAGEEGDFVGLIAEDLIESGSPLLHSLVAFDATGQPDSVNYDRLAVILISSIQRMILARTVVRDKVNKIQTAIDSRTTTVNNRLTAVNNTITTLQATVTAQQAIVATLQSDVAILKTQVASLLLLRP